MKPITPTNGTFLLEPHPNSGLGAGHVPILDTSPVHFKRKSHRKHYNNHHRHNTPRKAHKKATPASSFTEVSEQHYVETPLNPPASIVQEPYTSMPIPLILNSKEDKQPNHEHGEKRYGMLARKRTTLADVATPYEPPTYLNPFLTGELIFEK